jgi:hypothetical protein
LTRNHENVSHWSDMSNRGLLCQFSNSFKIQLDAFWSRTSHGCSCHDIAENSSLTITFTMQFNIVEEKSLVYLFTWNPSRYLFRRVSNLTLNTSNKYKDRELYNILLLYYMTNPDNNKMKVYQILSLSLALNKHHVLCNFLAILRYIRDSLVLQKLI